MAALRSTEEKRLVMLLAYYDQDKDILKTVYLQGTK